MVVDNQYYFLYLGYLFLKTCSVCRFLTLAEWVQNNRTMFARAIKILIVKLLCNRNRAFHDEIVYVYMHAAFDALL